MTRERRLAIEMWINIRNMLTASDGQSPEDISEYKRVFCDSHGLDWIHDCWFCTYVHTYAHTCVKCPLRSCQHGSSYAHVVDVYMDKDARIKACNNIIKALGGEV